MFKITIRFEGTQASLNAIIASLTSQHSKYSIGSGIAYPSNSYADSAPLEDSVYDKNVFGFGNPDLVPPFNEFGVPVANILHKFGFTTPGQTVVLNEVSAKDAAFYRTLQSQLADSGFVIEIEPDTILPRIDIGADDFATATLIGGDTFSLATDGVTQPDNTTGVRPAVEVVDRFGNVLELGIAFVVSYANNTEVTDTDPATVTVTGIGAYQGEIVVEFTITA